MGFSALLKKRNDLGKLSGRMLGLFRLLLVLLPLLALMHCFQVSQVLDWKDDGSMDVRWAFRFSKALEQAQSDKQQDAKGGENLSSQVEKAKKELPAKLKSLVKNLNLKKIDTEFDSGIEFSFQVADYAKFPFNKLGKEDFPLIPHYLPEKRQVVFYFEPMKKPEDKKKAETAKDEKKGRADNKEGSPGSGTGGDQPDSGDQFAAMGKQITQLFLSSVRYQIFLGKKFNPEKIYIKKGKEEKNIEMQRIFDAVMIDLPLFAMYGEKEEPFQVVVQMK
ncbi:MAG: hypothetical protein A2W19_05545 [Spirochaetes bacterium RBG_16_49_21]|nr:MAG: hypothetical protein A2W19_05545 [Spirochaetes bacterium RBG_16_49_21]